MARQNENIAASSIIHRYLHFRAVAIADVTTQYGRCCDWSMYDRLTLDSTAIELILWQWSLLPGSMG